MAQQVKNWPAIQETWEMHVQSLGWKDPLEKEWQPTPVFLPGKSHGQRSLAGYSPWGHKELDTTEHMHTHIACIKSFFLFIVELYSMVWVCNCLFVHPLKDIWDISYFSLLQV